MEKIKTKGFSAKDEFNASSATPIKMAKNSVLKVTDVMIKDKTDGETVGYLKTDDGIIFATISATVIEQLVALSEMLTGDTLDILVVAKTSNSGREYFMLELQ